MLPLADRHLLLLPILKQLDVAAQRVFQQLGLSLEENRLLVADSNLLLQLKLRALHLVCQFLGVLYLVLDLAALILQLCLVGECLSDLLLQCGVFLIYLEALLVCVVQFDPYRGQHIL